MRYYLFAMIFLMTLLPISTFSQRPDALKPYRIQLQNHQFEVDSIVKELIKIKEDSTSTDSLKVDIVHFLADLSCDICLTYLIEHIRDRFNYGEGISDTDQINEIACKASIYKIAEQEKKKWKLVGPCLNSIKVDRDNEFIYTISLVLSSVFTKTGLKAFIENEFQKNKWEDNMYKQNLEKLLTILSK